MVTYNIYFNKNETMRIAAGGGAGGAIAYILGKVPSAPTAVASLILGISSATVTAWALSARAANACVGIKLPLVGLRVPLPIYHRSGFCF